MSIYVLIPGEPCAQGRPRMTVVNGHARAYDPAKSRNWKGAARYEMDRAMIESRQLMIADGPIEVRLLAVHSCPRTDYRKREPMPRRWRDRKPDVENVVKACLDAATGILWRDDAQIARLVVDQVTGAQDEPPRVEMWARALEEVVVEWRHGDDSIKAIRTVTDAAEVIAGPGAKVEEYDGPDTAERSKVFGGETT